jgi:sugar/nucleoside kinase (ribokinase family)
LFLLVLTRFWFNGAVLAQMMAAIPYTDIMFGNETEAAAFGEKMGWGTDVATIAAVSLKEI